jgi:hypothetical protein
MMEIGGAMDLYGTFFREMPASADKWIDHLRRHVKDGWLEETPGKAEGDKTMVDTRTRS